MNICINQGIGKMIKYLIRLSTILGFICLMFRVNCYADTGSDTKIATALPDVFSGSMSYQIPIEVPSGRKGMAPQSALTYGREVSNMSPSTIVSAIEDAMGRLFGECQKVRPQRAALAAVSCNPGGYASVIGTELVAVQCVPDGMNDNTVI
jgi:hypothetical protein